MQWHVPPVPVEALRVVLLQQLKNGEQRLDVQVAGAEACGSTHTNTQRRRKRGEERATRHKHTLRGDRACMMPTNPAVPLAEPHTPTAGPLPQPEGRNGCLTRRYRLIAGSHTAAHRRRRSPARSNRQQIWPAGLAPRSAVAQALSSTYAMRRLVWLRSRRPMSCLHHHQQHSKRGSARGSSAAGNTEQ